MGIRNRIALAGIGIGVSLAAACGGDDPAEATSTPEGTVTATQAIAETRTIVPSITREVTNTPTTPSGPPSADTVSITEAFPSLPAIQRPVMMVEIPGQDVFLVVSQEGLVHVVANTPETADLHDALDWTDRTRRQGNEEGLLGLALSPEFQDDGYVFLYYTAAGGERRSVISRFQTTGQGTALTIDPASEMVILEVPQPYPNHNGGNIVFGPDGMFYVGLGDGGDAGDPHGNGQNLSTLLGSMLRIDVSAATEAEPYRIPDDNPFVGEAGARPETFAYGFRNPWRYSFDRATGDLWVGDVGQRSREEIDLVQAGGNYGWNIMEGSECYNADSCEQSGLTLPVVDYAREGGNCSVTGGYVARGDNAGTLAGWYLYGDYCSGTIWAIDAAQAAAEPEPVVIRDEGPQLASFAEDLDGGLYILAFDGRIYRIEG